MALGPKQYEGKMGYAFRPSFDLSLRSELKEGETREYPDGFEMEPGEVVTDGKDELAILLFMHRLDVEDPDEPLVGLEFKKIVWDFGVAKEEWVIAEDSDFDEPGKKRFLVKSKAILLYKRGSPSTVNLKVQASVIVPAHGPIKEKQVELTAELSVLPCTLFTQLWVVPSRCRHHSEAGAIVLVHPNRGETAVPLPGIQMELKVENAVPGGVSLRMADQETPTKSADDAGGCQWLLVYSGITMNTLAQARFKVKVRLENSEECVPFDISVGENVLSFLTAFQAAIPALDLTNPEWQHADTTIRNAVDWLWSDATLGLLYNARAVVGGPERYVCWQYAGRILDWAMQRRFGLPGARSTALVMNGIELSYYLYHPIHVFFGFQLSGQDPFSPDTRAIDPWWRQRVEDNVIMTFDEERGALKKVIIYILSYTAIVFMVFRAALFRFFPSAGALLTGVLKYLGGGYKVRDTVIMGGIGATILYFTFRLGVSTGDMVRPNWFDDSYQSYLWYNAGWLRDLVNETVVAVPAPIERIEKW